MCRPATPPWTRISRSGLAGLSTYVNRRTAVTLADPVAITPGQDDLSFYPLLYWPITADAQISPEATAALNEFTAKGGIILLDTRDGGSGEGFAPGTEAALKRVTAGLNVPPLAPLTSDHVLARAFYLLQDFPGRFDGDTVWVQRDQDRANDSVSPVIIGGHDWAAAWAVDASGHNPYATLPGGARQRTLAYRFGVNLVMYALTGNYKGDQVHVPGDPGAAGPMRLEQAYAALRWEPAVPLWALGGPRRHLPARAPARRCCAGPAGRCGARSPSPCCCSGWPARAWCRKPATPCRISACSWSTRPTPCASATAPRMRDAALATLQAAGGAPPRPRDAHGRGPRGRA